MTLGHPHIVLIEDNEATRYAVTRILVHAGFRLTPAADGETGMRLIRETNPDLVLLDVKLPDVSGFEVVDRLKADPETAVIPVVHLSATSISTAEQVRGLEGGADAYLTHPVEPQVLVATLNALLRARRAESRFRRVFETGLLGIVTEGAEGVLVDANDAFLRLGGWERADLAAGGLRWGDVLVAPSDPAPPARGDGGPIELVLRGKDGRRIPVLVGRAADATGADAIAFVLDISGRKTAEEALREADRRKDEFLAVLSHELRNPLAPIRNSIHILSIVDPGAPQGVRARSVIARQTEHLTRLVDDLLDVTRISRGKIELQRVRIDLAEVVRKAAEDMREMFDRSGVDLRVEPRDGPLWADADPTRMAQVVWNVLHNAMKFTPAGGRVEVRVARRGDAAEIAVRDTGIGLETAELERMFEPFAQADRSLARTQGGLGLGLALVRGLVAQHGGEVTARSEGPGRGTEVRVSIPLEVGSGDADVPGPRDAPASARVLVVEDNADAAETLADLLRLKGHEVRVARDGPTAIAIARALDLDVVLCDIGLAGMDGYAVARALRSDPQLAATRLVALSGYASPEDQKRAREAGFDAHVAKPPSVEAIDAVLAGPRRRPA